MPQVAYVIIHDRFVRSRCFGTGLTRVIFSQVGSAPVLTLPLAALRVRFDVQRIRPFLCDLTANVCNTVTVSTSPTYENSQ